MKKNLLFAMACAAAMVGGCAFDEKANKADSGETAPTTIVGNTTNEEPASEADKAEDKGDKGETKAEPECFLDSDCDEGFSCNSLNQCVERTVNPPPADTDDAGDAGTDDFGGEPVEPDEQETCAPTGDEICNGIDDNCSGMKDEGDLCTLGRSCKSGACACATGTALCDACTNAKTDRNNCGGCGVKCDADEVCQEGKCIGPDDPEPEPEPTPTCTPQAEICDGKDNDCDGATDEGDDGKALFRSCGFEGATPQGECKRGTQTCTAGQWGTCTGLISSSAETCDGKDNDCDGAIDNGVKNLCGTCAVVKEICDDGKGGQTGNGIDDDCDGQKDNLCTCTPGVKEACGTEKAGKGPCKAGERTCLAGGVWGECVGAVLPVAEKCDTVDNDCDGTTDEDFSQLGDACGEGVGVCVASGTFVCKAESGTECNATAGTPATEICDGLDNDCDGTKDDGQLCTDGQSCTSGACVCPSGTTLCGQNCRALQEDESNCGGCGSACASGEICNAGSCGTPPPCESGTVRAKYTTPTGKSGLIEVRDPGPLGTVYCASTTATNAIECVFTPPNGTSMYVQIDVDTNGDGIMDYTTGDLWGCNFWQGTGRIDGAIQAWKCGSGGAETAATVTALSVYGGGNCEIK